MLHSQKQVVYLSGPMTGIPDHNFPVFHEAATYLRECGLFVINPAETGGGEKGLDWHQYMRIDINYLLACTALVLLPGWEQSDGAIVEYIVARALGLNIFLYNKGEVPAVTPDSLERSIKEMWTW